MVGERERWRRAFRGDAEGIDVIEVGEVIQVTSP
jgi:hypothetical protein